VVPALAVGSTAWNDRARPSSGRERGYGVSYPLKLEFSAAANIILQMI
jgi:hypothetical protein